MKDLQQIKDEVATELGYKSNSVFSAHEQLLINPHGLNYKVISNYNDQIAIRYAQEQNKELVEMLEQCEQWIGNCNQYAPILKVIEELIKSETQRN